MFVSDVMTRHTVTASPRTTVRSALALLAEHRVTALPVVDGRHRLVGVVSEADLIGQALVPDPRSHLAPYDDPARPRAHRVEEVMTPHVVSVPEHTDLSVAVDLLTSSGAKSLPVTDEHGALAGMVSRSDIVRAVARSDTDLEGRVDELLSTLGHPGWRVSVTDGVVHLTGPQDHAERHLAGVVARTVAGVVDVDVD